ncbi:glutamic acid-rich protein isoform X3 [Eupeodes corollae]|nr:glutamic acid-rich protein isoform X3 [Eupeodes corollae]XP_055905247.1 glutamic acid-rich protein isoform X3 [Eupeodes corollae]
MEDEEFTDNPQEEEKSITLRIPKPMPPPKASIEERLREMQRKLSEIAEIPKILSSTLETVSQTFDKFLPPQPQNSYKQHNSYESDELDSVSDENDDVLSEPDSLEMECKYKDLTPESDYVSETHDFDLNETETETETNEDDSEDDEEQQYTWNSSNIPEVNIEETEDEEREPTEEDLMRQEKQEKMEKLERAWPWADREKIIYRQSTCHLVPRQPLGIVEDRIKLLAKQNLSALYERKQSDY